jgi:MFS superfamily sulfate permease-like transporter
LKVIILSLKNALSIDSSSVLVLKQLAKDMRARGKTLLLSGVTPEIRSALKDSGTAEVIDEDKILIAQTELLGSTRQAISRAENHLETVLEGKNDRNEENPVLKHTLEELQQEESDHSQNPVDEERVNPD